MITEEILEKQEKLVYILIRKDKDSEREEVYVGITNDFPKRIKFHKKEKKKEVLRGWPIKRRANEKDELDLTIGIALLFGPQNVIGSCYAGGKKSVDTLTRACLAVSNRCYDCNKKKGVECKKQSYHKNENSSITLWPDNISLDQYVQEIQAVRSMMSRLNPFHFEDVHQSTDIINSDHYQDRINFWNNTSNRIADAKSYLGNLYSKC